MSDSEEEICCDVCTQPMKCQKTGKTYISYCENCEPIVTIPKKSLEDLYKDLKNQLDKLQIEYSTKVKALMDEYNETIENLLKFNVWRVY